MDHWTDKQETRAAVDILIRNVLYEEIPDSMFDKLDDYRKAIFEHVYTHYKQAAWLEAKTFYRFVNDHLIQESSVFWCDTCNVPIYNETCPVCDNKGRRVGTDLFDDERLNNIIAVLSGPMSDSAL